MRVGSLYGEGDSRESLHRATASDLVIVSTGMRYEQEEEAYKDMKES